VLVLLPPSETKRPGGAAGSRLELPGLRWPMLTPQRESMLAALTGLAADAEATVRALKLGPRQRHLVEVNRTLASAPVLPALDRYTGVLYDALDAATLGPEARARAERMLAVQSALFGPVGAGDLIPAYRLSASSRLPGTRPVDVWAGPVGEVLAGEHGLLLDLRSESYAALGPLPERPDALTLRVVRGDDGRPVNHHNKRSKGLFVRALVSEPAPPEDADALVSWARERSFGLRRAGRTLVLTQVDAPVEAIAVRR